MPSFSSLEPDFVYCGFHTFLLVLSSDPPLSLAKVWLSIILTLSPLTIWYSGLTALLLFPLAKTAPAYLPTALSVALRSLFPFQQVQYAQVFPLKPAPFCTLCAGLGRTNKSAISFLFSCFLFLSDSHFVLATLSSPPFFLVSQTIWQELSSLSSSSIWLQWVPGLSILSRNDSADELARRRALLTPLQSLVISLLLSLVSTFLGLEAYCLISVLRHTGSLDFHRETCVPSSRSLCSLSSTL